MSWRSAVALKTVNHSIFEGRDIGHSDNDGIVPYGTHFDNVLKIRAILTKLRISTSNSPTYYFDDQYGNWGVSMIAHQLGVKNPGLDQRMQEIHITYKCSSANM